MKRKSVDAATFTDSKTLDNANPSIKININSKYMKNMHLSEYFGIKNVFLINLDILYQSPCVYYYLHPWCMQRIYKISKLKLIRKI